MEGGAWGWVGQGGWEPYQLIFGLPIKRFGLKGGGRVELLGQGGTKAANSTARQGYREHLEVKCK